MIDIFDRLRAVDYFAHAGEPLPSELLPFCVEETSWPKLYTEITSRYGEAWLLNAQNDLTGWLSANARDRYREEWNTTARQAKPQIKAIVEEAMRPRFGSGQWDDLIASHFESCLLGIVMAHRYSELRSSHAPLEFYDRLLAIFEAGCLPAGWRSGGAWPTGKFIVGRISPGSDGFETLSLSIEQIIDEGRRLAKPTWLLKDTPKGPPVAAWRGHSGIGTHWITVDSDEFEAPFGMRGSTSIIETDDLSFVVQCHETARLGESGGTPLFAHMIRPLPPPFALEQESERIQSWIASRDPERQAKFDAYIEAYQAECPFYRRDDELYAVVSGWPIELYEGDWAGRYRHESQLLLTFKDAEPWVELVRHRDGSLSARGIIT